VRRRSKSQKRGTGTAGRGRSFLPSIRSGIRIVPSAGPVCSAAPAQFIVVDHDLSKSLPHHAPLSVRDGDRYYIPQMLADNAIRPPPSLKWIRLDLLLPWGGNAEHSGPSRHRAHGTHDCPLVTCIPIVGPARGPVKIVALSWPFRALSPHAYGSRSARVCLGAAQDTSNWIDAAPLRSSSAT